MPQEDGIVWFNGSASTTPAHRDDDGGGVADARFSDGGANPDQR